MHTSLRFFVLLVVSCALPGTAFAAPSLVQIAREFTGGLQWLDPDVRPALAENGTVAFTGSHDHAVFDPTRVFVGDGGALSALDLVSAGLSEPRSVELTDLGQIALLATRTAGMTSHRGAYTTTTASGTFATLYEGKLAMSMPGDPLPVTNYNVAMSPNGTIAFSAIVNGAGALYRAPFGGALTLLRQGSGTYFNTQRVAVNDSGEVAVQMEYFDPTMGLSRGILSFEVPGDTLTTLDTAIERQSVATQPMPSINASGKVAFSLNGTVTMTFFDPPGVFGTVLEEVELEPGVYVAEPTPWGTPKHPVLIAGIADGYASFGHVVINDLGEVAFEAAANGEFGVFVGPDPVAHKVLATGDVLGSQLFSVVRLGEINNAGEISLLTSDFNSTDRQIWRAEGAFAPPEPRPFQRLRALLRKILRFILQH